ncbi:hypothetical protein [Nocardioides sp. LHG3406-4]|uniref:hypothetical protein n=1 Tax=Nocardioides sp. LHG3406-4 TaxID=2804575 RepID=UPI003CEF0A42
MTARDLASLLLRRWYLMALGAAVSVGALVVSVQQPPIFWTQFEVVVLPPVESSNPNNLQDASYGMTPMAGLLVTELNDGRQPRQFGSSSTTLYGEGQREGYRVRLRNIGTQWQPVYDAPVIDVQVVDSDPDTVTGTARRLTDELGEILRGRQVDLGVRPESRMTLRASPADPVIYQVGGSRTRAALSIALLGASSTTILVVFLDRWLARRRRAA